jgi:histidinol phosphatase-like enzyme (inositol monophosphatase family)
MPADALKTRLELALALAREAGEITLRYFRRDNFRVERKADDSPVTAADREAEQHLRRGIAAAFPDDGILGEEFGEQPGSSGYRWILDPIDGTKSFIYGVPLYGQLVGVERERRSVVGVINIPALDECVYAAAGQGAWYRCGTDAPRKAAVSAVPRLADGLLLTSDLEGYKAVGQPDVLRRLTEAAWITRTWGDCYGYLLVATGRAEAMVDPRMHVWDAAALQPILEEAGGSFTDWQGQASIYTGNAVASNGKVADEVLQVTRGQKAEGSKQ